MTSNTSHKPNREITNIIAEILTYIMYFCPQTGPNKRWQVDYGPRKLEKTTRENTTFFT